MSKQFSFAIFKMITADRQTTMWARCCFDRYY